MSNPKDWAEEAAEAVSACPCTKCIAPKADAIRTALAVFVVVPKEQSDIDADMLLSALQGRCPCCRWPLVELMEQGCILGNCSYRPGENSPEHDGWLKRAKRSRELLLAAPPSPRGEGEA